MFLDATSYVNEPPLELTVPVLAGAWVWQGAPLSGLPPRAKCEDVARRNRIVIIDSESWDLADSGQYYTTMVAWMRGANPTCVIGAYGVPKRDYWRAIMDFKAPEYAMWQAENNLLAPAALALDWLCPSLYTFYDVSTPVGLGAWARYAVANVTEARRIGAKKVAAFLWPEYHGSNKALGGQYIPAAAFAAQLKLAKALCDHVVVWGGQGKPFAPTGWWDVVNANA